MAFLRRLGAGGQFRVSLCARCALLPLLLMGVHATARQAPEHHVKAAFLLNFTKFVEWPPSAFEGPDAPLEICILDDDSVSGALEEMVQGEAINGRKLAVQRIRRVPGPKSCEIFFIGQNVKEQAALLADVPPGILTVGEGEGFLRDGGIIGFVSQDRHLRFDINQRAAMKASLVLSARLLRVARSVRR